MSLDRLFPDHEIYRSLHPDVPSLWRHLIALPLQEALVLVGEYLSITEPSRMYRTIGAATDLGILAPRRKRERRNARTWTLAVLYAPSRALLFGCPTPDLLYSTFDLPREYIEVVTKLGNMRFDQHAGVLIWPAFVEKTANDICLAQSDSSPVPPLMPFYDHKTGDFDCWLDREFTTSFVFNHESCKLQKYCDGGFVTWMQQRFEDNLNT
jgi:hypothetical protein